MRFSEVSKDLCKLSTDLPFDLDECEIAAEETEGGGIDLKKFVKARAPRPAPRAPRPAHRAPRTAHRAPRTAHRTAPRPRTAPSRRVALSARLLCAVYSFSRAKGVKLLPQTIKTGNNATPM